MQASEVDRQSQLESVLSAGLDALDLDAEVGFQQYTRVVLPIDGYVFWKPTVPFTAQGSLHHSQEIIQEEDQTLGLASCTFTTKERITQFAELPIYSIGIARVGRTKFAFSRQDGYYSEARLWHYFGHSIYPAMESQLLSEQSTIDPKRAIVSNSLPLWLALNGYQSPYVGGFSNSVTLYPSFLTEPNLTPPYGAVHVSSTRALQAVPHVKQMTVTVDGVSVQKRVHDQLMADQVRVTLYGLQHDEAMDFLDCVLSYSETIGTFGLMNMPAVTDGKRPQAELAALAMQKIIEFEVSYYQCSVAEVALQLIKKACITYIPGSTIPGGFKADSNTTADS